MKKLAILCLAAMAGCVGVPKVHVEADRAIFDAIAPEYRAYVEADERLPESVREAKLRTLKLWREMIEAFEKEAK